MLFGAAYYPEHRDPAKWDYDLDNMAAANLNAVRVGEFAWVRFEPADGRYDFEWMDTFVEKAARRGIGVVMCPPLRTAPAWLVERDPDVLTLDWNGVRLPYGTRYTFCLNNAILRSKGMKLATEMGRRYGPSEDVIGWHLDNEFGADAADCHCPVCVEKWHGWLEARYGSIGALNRAWGTVFWGLEFDKFAQVPTRAAHPMVHNPGLQLAWRRFQSDTTCGLVAEHAAAVRKHAPERQFITTNFQTLWNKRTDYYKMAESLDVAGLNYYPSYGPTGRSRAMGLANCRVLKHRGFHVYELRNGPHAAAGRAGNTPEPGEVERLTLHVVANGADGVFYFRWRACPFGTEQTHGSLTDYDGRPKRVYAEAARIGEKLRSLAPALEGTKCASEVAIFYDFPTRWIVESGARWSGPQGLYLDLVMRLYTSIRGRGVNCDAIGRREDFSRYKLLVAPIVTAMDDEFASALVRFVEGGGSLVFHPECGLKDDEAAIYPDRLHPALKELFGVELREFATLGEDETQGFSWRGKSYAGTLFCDLPSLKGAESLAEYTGSWFAGTPAVTLAKAGRGRAIHVATYADESFYDDFFTWLLGEIGVGPILDTEIPPEIEVAERSAPDPPKAGRLVFLLNSSSAAQAIELPRAMEDLWNRETVRGRVTFAPHQVRVLKAGK